MWMKDGSWQDDDGLGWFTAVIAAAGAIKGKYDERKAKKEAKRDEKRADAAYAAEEKAYQDELRAKREAVEAQKRAAAEKIIRIKQAKVKFFYAAVGRWIAGMHGEQKTRWIREFKEYAAVQKNMTAYQVAQLKSIAAPINAKLLSMSPAQRASAMSGLLKNAHAVAQGRSISTGGSDSTMSKLLIPALAIGSAVLLKG